MSDDADDGRLYAVVEILGRRTRAGALSDAVLGGATLLRIEHPTEPERIELYAPTSLFAIRPCSRAETIKVASWAWPTEADRTLKALASTSYFLDEDGDEDDDDEDYR